MQGKRFGDANMKNDLAEIRRIQRHFEERADKFDALYETDSESLGRFFNRVFRKGLYERLRLTLEWMGDMRGKSVLDLGCGSGRLAVAAAVGGADPVVGVDLSQPMLDLAERRAAAEGMESRCRFHRLDFFRYQPPQRFDFTVALGVFDYIESPVQLIRKMTGATRGSLIASFPGKSLLRGNFRRIRYYLRNCPLYLYSEASIRSAFLEAGIEDPRIERYPSAGFLVMARMADTD